MNISYKTEYALRALVEIVGSSSEDLLVGSKAISEKQRIPHAFLSKILLDLQKAKIVRSIKGPGGGFTLEKPKDQISFWNIYQAVESSLFTEYKEDTCFPKLEGECELYKDCKIKHMWSELNTSVKNKMEELRLSEFL